MFRFKCGNCDEWHEGPPSLECRVPDPLLAVPPHQRQARVSLTSETAVLDGAHFFVRTCMEVPIKGTGNNFVWGLWVEVTEQDILDYSDMSQKGTVGGPYRGALANSLPFYPDCLGMPVSVQPQPGDKRPLLFTPEGESSLARHLRDGMTELEARTFFERVLHPGTQ
jgi:hypothetical protein